MNHYQYIESQKLKLFNGGQKITEKKYICIEDDTILTIEDLQKIYAESDQNFEDFDDFMISCLCGSLREL